MELPAPAPEVERISPNEQTYLQALLRRQQELQLELQSFVNFLSFEYKLTQADQVTPDGEIVRGANDETAPA